MTLSKNKGLKVQDRDQDIITESWDQDLSLEDYIIGNNWRRLWHARNSWQKVVF